MTHNHLIARATLRGGSALSALALLGAGFVLATPAFAQDASTQNQPATTVNGAAQLNNSQATPDTQATNQTANPTPADQAAAPADQAADQPGDIVVTGSIFRRTDTETPSPVTTLTADNLQKAGITNVTDAVRSISADNSGSIPTSFTAGFGSGGSGVSLRGLGVNSTLVLIDGLRTANYPFNDDGVHAFTDLNSIPFSLIDRVEVLKDGASSTYGADAIGGVVNLIMRKHITGLEGTIEGGVSERGDANHQRATLTAGYGDFDEKGWNVYVNGEYEHDGSVYNKDRGFPYNTTDLSSIGGLDNNASDQSLTAATTYAYVRRTTQSNPLDPRTGGVAAFGDYQALNLANCAKTFTVASTATSPGGTGCAQDLTNQYAQIAPSQTRYSFTGRASFKVGENAEAYLTGSYFHNEVLSSGVPRSIRAQAPTGAASSVASNNPGIVLPALLSNGQRNPNNPFAAEGNAARIYYNFGDIPFNTDLQNEVIRGQAGITGTFGDGWGFQVEGSAAKSTLDIAQNGYLNINGLINAINTGSYNFVNPGLNTQAVRDSISPTVNSTATSELYMAQATVTKDLLTLPGGPLQLGVGGQIRYEKLNDPNQNPDLATYGLNTFSASGHHTVSAAYFEVNAPILDQLEVDASGRYDHYSEGFGHFSPKIGVKFTPIKELALRGTYSKGFRAPGFAEVGRSQFVGYINYTPPPSFVAAHGDASNPYSQTYTLGYLSVANPDLKPEKSRSFTGGAVFQPLSWLSFTADYYNIKKTNIVAAGPLSGDATAAYFAGQPLPAGYTVTTVDAPDPLAPNALARPLVITQPFVNGSSLKTSGIDVSMTANFKLTEDTKFTSKAEVTEIFTYNFKPDADSPVQRYVGTQGPYNLSSGAGTPRWRANWQNTLQLGAFGLTGTAYYTSGFKNVSADQGPDLSCDANLYGTGEDFCHTKGFIDVDLNASIKVNDQFTFYVNAYNLLDVGPALTPDSYSAVNYIPTWSYNGIIGRSFRAGANFKF